MTRDLSISLLNRAADGAQLLEILESIATDLETQGIADCAAHFAEINAPTSDPITSSGATKQVRPSPPAAPHPTAMP
jgi:hypothetical protein